MFKYFIFKDLGFAIFVLFVLFFFTPVFLLRNNNFLTL